MSDDWQPVLNRWASAGLIDATTAESIRAWESEQGERPGRNRFAVFAFCLGGLLLIAGVLLFVASNWQQISPVGRLILVTAAVGLFHVGGAFAGDARPALGTTLHAVGTGALGAGIFLSGQTFHLAENWPEGFLLWAIGSAVALYFLRDWPHVLFTAVLAPMWIVFEWAKLTSIELADRMARPASAFLALLAVAYLTAAPPTDRSTWRKVLARLGAVGVIPAAIIVGAAASFTDAGDSSRDGDVAVALAWLFAVGLPLGLAYALRRREAVIMPFALLWVLAVLPLDGESDSQFLALLVLYALGSVGIVLWGLRDRHPLLANVGVLGFALSVLAFYFATDLFSKLGRSLGLIGAGLLFIGGGWFLERTRRTIIRRMDEEGR
jgi:uncharacterized membrane protein